MRGDQLGRGDHVVRWVPRSKLRRTREGHIVGLKENAFFRDGDNRPSTTWVEYFRNSADAMCCVRQCISRNMRTSRKDRLVLVCVGEILDKARVDSGRDFQVTHQPIEEQGLENPGHCELEWSEMTTEEQRKADFALTRIEVIDFFETDLGGCVNCCLHAMASETNARCSGTCNGQPGDTGCYNF